MFINRSLADTIQGAGWKNTPSILEYAQESWDEFCAVFFNEAIRTLDNAFLPDSPVVMDFARIYFYTGIEVLCRLQKFDENGISAQPWLLNLVESARERLGISGEDIGRFREEHFPTSTPVPA